MAKTRTHRVVWGLVALEVVMLLVGGGLMLRAGVQVGKTRVHWHPLQNWSGMKRAVVENSEGGFPVGKAYCLGWGAVCVYRSPNSGLEPDWHVLTVFITDDLHERVE
jgi:hypothetical protein